MPFCGFCHEATHISNQLYCKIHLIEWIHVQVKRIENTLIKFHDLISFMIRLSLSNQINEVRISVSSNFKTNNTFTSLLSDHVS